MLIATSVVFIILGTQLFALTAFPSFKVAFGGLPIKITGFVFGPIIGAITGVISDLLSFMFVPFNYFPGYTLIMALSGLIPGIVMLVMVKRKRSSNVHFISTTIILLVIFISILLILFFMPTTKLKKGEEGNKTALNI
jgi:ECF transporter S component (folate family)